MPIFEFECPTHGCFEELLSRFPSNESHVCPCHGCLIGAPLVPSRVAMQPDSLWAGHVVEGYGYVTSASKLAKIKKDKGHITLSGRDDMEAMKKMAAEGRKARDEKLDRDIKEVFDEHFTGSGVIDSFGAPVPGAFDKLSDTPITSGDDPRLA